MSLRATFTLPSILKYNKQQEDVRFNSQLNAFTTAGESFISETKDNNLPRTFTDYTGNLRSSIGYVIVYNGKQVAINFSYSSLGSEREIGLQKGIELAEEISKQYKTGFAMVCVAGMGYALTVEQFGKTVITQASLNLSQKIREILSSL